MTQFLTALGLFGAVALIAANGYFVAAEFSFVAARRSRFIEQAEEGDRRARRAVAVHKRLSFMLSGAQLGITVTTLVLGFIAEPAIAAVIEPALDILRGRGIALTGPMPADTLFHAAARRTYDAAICMYHDQALIPLKTIDFDGGVNITLGLPIVRTSPDHGTAFDIAGTGRANPASLIAAIKRAAEIAANRSAFERAA